MINKATTIARQNGTNTREAVYDMLQTYCSTPHPATRATPYELLMNRQVRTIIDHAPLDFNEADEIVRTNDQRYKQKSKAYYDKRNNTSHHTIKEGDAVLVKRENKRKAQTPFEPYIYIVTKVKGSQLEARRKKDGRIVTRDASKFKPLSQDEEEPVLLPNTYVDIPLVGTTDINNENEQVLDNIPQQPAPNTPPPQPPRRSERTRKSVFDARLKDYRK